MKRVHLVNVEPRYLFSVKRVAVFGSFLEICTNLGDVDVAVDLQPRIPLDEKGDWVKTFREHAWNSGRSFSTFEEEVDWPRREVLLALKSRKRSISIQPWLSFVEMSKAPDFQFKVLIDEQEGNRSLNCESSA